MSEKEENMDKLREEVNILKEQLLKISERLEETKKTEKPEEKNDDKDEDPFFDEDEFDPFEDKPWKKINPKIIIKKFDQDWGDRLSEYIGEFVDDVMVGVSSELERSLFVEPRRREHSRPTVMTDREIERTSAVMSAMGNEHRVKALRELSWGGLYASELQEILKEISPSTLSSHLDVLEEVGLIVQERRRGRYVITMAGRIAIKMAAQVAKRTSFKSNGVKKE